MPGDTILAQAPVGTTTQPIHRVVLNGIDTLELTAGSTASVPSEWLLTQHDEWLEYQQNYEQGQEYKVVELPNGSFWQLYPYGNKTYRYQLSNPELGFIRIWNPTKFSSASKGKQHIHYRLTSKLLHSYDRKQLYNWIVDFCGQFFASLEGVEFQVSRLDLHTDITNGQQMLTEEEVSNTITRSRVRRQHFEDDLVELTAEEQQVLYGTPDTYNKGVSNISENLLKKFQRLYEQQVSVGSGQIIRKRELETAYFGKFDSDIHARIYNKTKQVKIKRDNDTENLWIENGWNKEDVVVRVEISMRRDFLKSLDNAIYVSLENMLLNVDKIWAYVTQNWIRMVESIKENNIQLSVISDFWKIVSASFHISVETVIRKKSYKGRVEQLFQQGVGCIKQMISLSMFGNEDTFALNHTIRLLENHLRIAQGFGEYQKRRQLLGIA
jgi:hypothetical protein